MSVQIHGIILKYLYLIYISTSYGQNQFDLEISCSDHSSRESKGQFKARKLQRENLSKQRSIVVSQCIFASITKHTAW